jgi:hypothetical protein
MLRVLDGLGFTEDAGVIFDSGGGGSGVVLWLESDLLCRAH